MKMHLIHLLGFWLALNIGLAQESASEPAEPAANVTPAPASEPASANVPAADEAAIPAPFPVKRYEASWKKNPFLLKTTPIVQATVSFADDWSLAGMFKDEKGKVQVTIQNKQTGGFKHLTNDDSDPDGFRLVEATFNRNRDEASAKIGKGSETVTLKYEETTLSRPVTINNTQRPTAVPGQPGGAPVRPGQPGAPGAATGRPGGVQAVVSNPAAGQPFTGAPVGVAGGQPVMPNTMVNQPGTTPASPGVPPTISRRRQLIPPPVVQPQQ